MNHSLSHCCQVAAPVEAVIEGTQLAISVLIKFQGMEGAAEAGFQVAEDRVDPAEYRQFIGMTSFHNHSLMQGTDFCHCAKANQTIRYHFTSYCQLILCPVSNGAKGEHGPLHVQLIHSF